MEFQSMWPVVPLCKAQLEDVNPLDVLNGGLYRRCNTYKGGGGYDKFPEIWERRLGKGETKLNDQFVVQVQGCPLHCPSEVNTDWYPVWSWLKTSENLDVECFI